MTRSRTSPSSAAPASTPSSRLPTPRSTPSRRRTATRRRRSRSGPSPAGGWRSCRGTAGTTTSRRTGSTTAPTSGRSARSASGRCWRRARWAGCRPRSRPATSWSPTSSSTAPAAASRRTSSEGAVHLPFADPYCPRVSDALVAAAPDVRRGGTMVVIEGPRFSTRAESRWYAAQGGTLINMTGAPEAALARELRMCYSALALVTDMDAGAEGETGRRPGGGVRAVPQQPRAAHRAADRRGRGAARPRRLHLLDLGRRHRADLRRARVGGQ